MVNKWNIIVNKVLILIFKAVYLCEINFYLWSKATCALGFFIGPIWKCGIYQTRPIEVALV